MQNKIVHFLRMGLVWLMCLSCNNIKAQSVAAPKIESPNVTSIERFGDIPVDFATGIPNISIPIHTVHCGRIDVPIGLRYHPGGVKIAQHPGWVGMGWDLQSIGSITRKINWLPDEYYASQTPAAISSITYGSVLSTYFPMPVASPPTSGSEQVDNASDWNTSSRLANYFGKTLPLNDVCADEFTFNFMGYSGKFYYVSPSKGWQVIADQNIKVELTYSATPRLSGSHVIGTITGNYSGANIYHLHPGEAWSSASDATDVFSGFTLTLPDGSKYYFGGIDANGNGVGIEFTAQYGAQITQFIANTWLLTKIIDVNNNEIDFSYSASYPTVDLAFGYNADSWSCLPTNGGWLSNSFGNGIFSSTMDVNTHGGLMTLPLYLDKITCPNETVTFNRGDSRNSLRVPDNMLTFIKSNGSNVSSNYFNLGILYDGVAVNGQIIHGPDNLQWEQLNNIVITNSYNQIYRQYQFNYSTDPNQRLTLTSFLESDNASPSNSIKKYTFGYNTSLPATALYDGNYSDHWGFYNNISIAAANPSASDGTTGSINYLKQTNQSVVTNGLLNNITYPTGGYTSFTWQAHDYSQVVLANRQGLSSMTGFAGGSRISEMKSFLADGSVALDKKYIYVRGYTNATPTGTGSSGILNGTPTYYMNLTNRPGFNNQINESVSVTSLNSLANYGYNSRGSYLGYDEVIELNADKSYTRNFFTSYGTDLNGIPHNDVQPPAALGWAAGDIYYSMSTLEGERGKPTAVYKYTASDLLVEKTIYTYRNDAGRFNNFIKLINFNGVIGGCGNSSFDALVLATSNQKFTYSYYITNVATTTFDQQGKNPIMTSKSTAYNIYNLDSITTEINSKGESIVTTYKYPFNYGDATSLAMTAAHNFSPVIETATSKNGSMLKLAHTNYYVPTTGIYVPQTVQLQVGGNPIEMRQQFYQYDSKGNVQEQSKSNDMHEVYLWGYNNQYPVAKITGSTYNAAIAIVTQAQIDAATSTSSNDAGVRTLLQALRSGLPNALVTTYTYLPLAGITSETDPRGQVTFYEYDSFQRLKLIKDFAGNILKTFDYQYQIAQ